MYTILTMILVKQTEFPHNEFMRGNQFWSKYDDAACDSSYL